MTYRDYTRLSTDWRMANRLETLRDTYELYFLYGTYSYLLTGRDSALMTYKCISLDSEAYEESTGLSGFNELWPISEGSGEVK